MNPETLLYRHVNQDWVQQGVPSSQTFRPTQKDHGKLSVYDGDIIVHSVRNSSASRQPNCGRPPGSLHYLPAL
jgi:hypothetical protein